jgi:hypothetical protein
MQRIKLPMWVVGTLSLPTLSPAQACPTYRWIFRETPGPDAIKAVWPMPLTDHGIEALHCRVSALTSAHI